jgi:hypothetical protein
VVPHPSLGFADLESLPSRYAFVSDPVALDTPTAEVLRARVCESLPYAEIVSIQRFANKLLWRQYTQQREIVAEQNDGDANVKLCFHGTKNPSLVLGSGRDSNSEGFNPNIGGGGAYSASGCGAYFATHAAYPVNIHPKRANEDGSFDLIIAEVACGSVCDLGDRVDNSLKRPPQRTEVLLHHSVRGTEEAIGVRTSTSHIHGEQFVVYNHHQAYPHFLITVRTGYKSIINVHSRRHLYASKGAHGEDKVGADKQSAQFLDGKWTITYLGDGTATIINVHSGRQLYAAEDAHWEAEVGADEPDEIGDAGTWTIKYLDDPTTTCTIINAHSGRQLYAAKDAKWETKFGAEIPGPPPGNIGKDGTWEIIDAIWR